MAESYSVTAVLSAVDKNFSSVFGSAQGAADGLASKIKSGLGFGTLMGIGMKAVNAATSSLSGFTNELESTSAAWKTFEQNAVISAEKMGIKRTEKDIAKVRKSLETFAQKTIYSASDMATTYAQLDAVGIKSAESLVKGFGGIAAAAENPQQAMKTLSQQGVQMAAKPKVAWQDFKLMLEQTPAGIAAVASEMGMTTAEMVQAVQDGKIKTEEFFKAIKKVGTSDDFKKMAESYKTTGQALDGLSETVTNTLMPSFELFQSRAIDVVSSVIEKVESFDGQKIADTIGGIFDAFDSGGITGAIGEITGLLDKLPDSFKQAAAAAGALGAVSLTNTVLDSSLWRAGVAGINTFKDVSKTLPGALMRDFGKARSAVQNFGYDLLNTTSKTFPQLLTGLSNVGDKATAPFIKIGTAAKTAWGNLTNDSVLGKITGFAGKVTGVLGKIGSGILGVGGKLAGGLQTMMGIAMKALLPAALIGAALAGLGVLYSKFGDQIDNILAMVQEKGPEIITKLADGISSKIPELISKGSELVSGLLDTIGAVAPSAIAAGEQIIMSLVNGVAQNAPQLITSAVTAVGGFASGVLSVLPSLLTTGMQLLLSIAQGISANLPRMAQGAMAAVQNFAQGFISNLPTILTTAGQIIVTLVQGITQALPQLVSGAVGVISTLASGFIQNLPLIIQTGVQVVVALAAGLLSAIGTLISNIPSIFSQVGNAIMTTDWLSVGSKIIDAIGNGIMGGIAAVGGKIGEFFGGIGDWITGGEKGGQQYAEAASASITANTPTVTSAAQEAATAASDGSASFFLNSGTAGGQGLVEGFSTGVLTNMGTMTDSVNNMMSSTSEILSDSSIQSDADSAGQDIVQSAADGIDSGASAAETALQNTMTSALSVLGDSSVEAQTAGESLGTAVVTGITTGLEPIGEAAKAAVDSAVSSMQGGLSSMQSAGQQAGARFAVGIRTGLIQASTAAKTSVKAIITSLKSVVSPAQSAGRNAGSKFAAGIRSVVSAARTAGNSAGKAAVAGMKSGASSAQSAGASAGSKFASGVSSKSGSAHSAGSSLAHAAKSGMSGVSTTGIGRDMGQGLANGLNSKYGTVAAAARRLANAAAQAMRAAAQVHSPSKVTYKIGEYIAAGLNEGIKSKVSSTEKVAASLAKTLTSAIDNTLQFQRWGAFDYLRKATMKIGEWGTTAASYINNAMSKMKNAFGSGMKSTASSIANSFKTTLSAKMKNISDAATGYITSATNDMVDQAKKEQERYQKAYDYNSKLQKEYEKKAKDKKASTAEKKAAAQKAKEYADLATKYKAAADKYKNLVTSYTKAGSSMKTAFTSAFNTAVNNAVSATANAITKLGETYQAQYDAIIKARESFRDKMREISLGEYDDEKKSVTALTDYNVAKRQVEQYGANLEKLKSLLPSSMMDEILAMDTEEGLAYTEKLLSKGTAWLKDYAKSYNSYLSATEKVSNKYYQSQIDTLKSNYTKAVEAEFKKLQSSLKTIGQQVMQGFAEGMKSKKTALDNAGKTLADSVINTLKKKLKIASPSKVMKSIGSYTGEGFVNGIDDEVKAAREAMQKLVETPSPQVAMAAGSENLRLHDEYNYTSNRRYTFEAVTTLDGREIARSTAEYTEDELERRRRNDERLKGRR